MQIDSKRFVTVRPDRYPFNRLERVRSRFIMTMAANNLARLLAA